MNRPPPVVVGLDGSTASWAALDWAADAAKRRATDLIVTHAGDVGHDHVVTAQEHGDDGGTSYGRSLLVEAALRVANRRPFLTVRTELRRGSPTDLLLALSEAAQLVVIGRGRTPGVSGALTGSTTHRVAAHACCPVVVVTGAVSTDVGDVVIGASLTPGGLAAMRFGCQEATLRRTGVVGVRSSADPELAMSGFGYPVAGSFEAWHEAQRTMLGAWLQHAAEEFPDLELHGELSESSVDLALQRSSQGAALLVLGSRRPNHGPLTRLGPITSWLAGHAHCPVAIIVTNPNARSDVRTAPADVEPSAT